MKLEIGKEEKALEFIKNIKGEKTILISHTDLDGITAAKIISRVVSTDSILFLDYLDLNQDLVKKLKSVEAKRIIFTDLYIKDEEFVRSLEEFAEILIIDHHLSPDLNSNKTVFIRGEKGYSAGYLCYYLFSKIKNLEELDWLVACSCISDYCHVKPKEWLEKVFIKYGDKLEYEGDYIRKSGKFWDLQYKLVLALIYFKENTKKVYDSIGKEFGNMGNLGEHSKEVKEEVERIISKFKEEKEEVDEGYFFQFNQKFSVGSIVSSILSGREPNKSFIIIRASNQGFYHISIRRQDGKLDCNAFLQKLLEGLEGADGGGHVPAAGGYFRQKDLPEIRKRLDLK
jgi:single-stranded DNA-specific DHH superfamily exonuclease